MATVKQPQEGGEGEADTNGGEGEEEEEEKGKKEGEEGGGGVPMRSAKMRAMLDHIKEVQGRSDVEGNKLVM